MNLHELDGEQRDVRALAARFSDEVVAPQAASWDRERRFPQEVIGQLGELGLMGVCVAPELGGMGADFLTYVLVLEELSRGDAGLGVTLAVHTGACTLPIVAHGCPAQVQRLVPPLAQGHELAAYALAEPGSGSDMSALRTSAQEGKISGAKRSVTNGSKAHVFLVFAQDPEEPSAFIVRRGAPGLRPTREQDKLGLHSSITTDLDFAETPGERLGSPGMGSRIALSALDGARIGIAAQAVGIAQAALDCALKHAKERHALGKPAGADQAIEQMLADMDTEIEAARSLTWRAARLKDAGRAHTVASAQAKLFASAVARRVTGDAVQGLGGAGYTRDTPAERYYRDAKVTEMYAGTAEMQRMAIARSLLGEVARE